MSNTTRGLVALLLLSSPTACARVSASTHARADATPMTARVSAPRGPADATRLALESQPSPSAATLLPAGARYRVVFVAPQEVALLVTDPRGQIAGRVRIRSLEHAGPNPGAMILVDDFDGAPARVDVWPTSDGLRGEASVGQRSASWQVHMDRDGVLAGERWSSPRGGDPESATNLRRARAIGHDLGQITRALTHAGSVDDRRLLELVELAELSLELSVRAWDRQGRANLPRAAM